MQRVQAVQTCGPPQEGNQQGLVNLIGPDHIPKIDVETCRLLHEVLLSFLSFLSLPGLWTFFFLFFRFMDIDIPHLLIH